MARTLKSPEAILPTRMTLHIPLDTALRFSVLDFPYRNSIQIFVERFKIIYQHKFGKPLPFEFSLPYRQLNDALLALAPSLIQAFEGDYGAGRMVAFTHFAGSSSDEVKISDDFPSQEQLKSLIRHWLERWSVKPTIQPLLKGDGKNAWQTLLGALDGKPETEWRHSIVPTELSSDLSYEKGLAYIALPALLTTLLHNQTMIIQSEKGEHPITWRRVNDGGKDGLHLISQPIRYHNDYFAYRLDFSVQTQAGYMDRVQGRARAWVFAHLSIQRYVSELYRKGDDNRNISVLVGFNRERFISGDGWDDDTTLIRLGVKPKKGGLAKWESEVGNLLDDFAVRKLLAPDEILTTPQRYGNYGGLSNFTEDEYYVVFAEGRIFGDERGRGHQIPTGTTLRERSQIMAGVLSILDGWLDASEPFQLDRQIPKDTTFALRDYDYMVQERKDNTAQCASWQTALKTSLASGKHSHLHVVVLHRNPDFLRWVKPQLETAMIGADQGENPLATVTYISLPLSLSAPLDSGALDPKTFWLSKEQKPAGFMDQWNKQMKEIYPKKREHWREFLRAIEWSPNARRLILIDAPDQFDLPPNQRIKGAVRDACNRENISSQFIIGDRIEPETRESHKGKLKPASGGKLKNATLDLIVRQQAIMYAPPSEIYERAAEIDGDTARQLDVITFCRMQRTIFGKFNYVLAVRLRADGGVTVMLPGDSSQSDSFKGKG